MSGNNAATYTQLHAKLVRAEERVQQLEAELAKLREQEPVAWMYVDSWGTHFTEEKREVMESTGIEEVTELYAAHVPAPAVPNEIGLGKGEFVIWPVKIGGVHGLAFVKTNDPQAVGAFHAEPEDGQIELGAGDSVIHFGNAESAMVLAERLQYVIALLQSAEVRNEQT